MQGGGAKEEIYSVLTGFTVSYSSVKEKYQTDSFCLDNPDNSWTGKKFNNTDWIQVSSGFHPVKWIAVITQGKPTRSEWVQAYKVLYTMNGNDWKYVDAEREFEGNVNETEKVRNDFKQPVIARALRIHPTKFKGAASLRFDAICLEP